MQEGNSYSSSRSGKKTLKFPCQVRMVRRVDDDEGDLNVGEDDLNNGEDDHDDNFDIFSGLLSK